MTNEVPKFEDMPLPIRTHENYTKVLKSWLEAWKKETDSENEALQKQVEELTPSKEAVKYMISVWDEVTGKTWREKPDHVQMKFIAAEQALKE